MVRALGNAGLLDSCMDLPVAEVQP
jgi:hypothetical protein